MKRASKLSTAEDFAIEERREHIRDARTKRCLSIILCISFSLTLPGLDDEVTHVISTLFRTVASV